MLGILNHNEKAAVASDISSVTLQPANDPATTISGKLYSDISEQASEELRAVVAVHEEEMFEALSEENKVRVETGDVGIAMYVFENLITGAYQLSIVAATDDQATVQATLNIEISTIWQVLSILLHKRLR